MGMDAGEMELFLENMEEFVMDENKIVTFKYLACTLNINVNQAKCLLREYAFPGGKRRAEVNITYVLGGKLLDDKGYNISLVREDDISKVEKRFASIDLKEIFCVHKVSSIIDLNVIYGIDGNLHDVKPRLICKNATPRAPRAKAEVPVAAVRPPAKAMSAAAPKEACAKEVDVPAKTAAAAKTGIASMFGAAAAKKSTIANSKATKPKKGDIYSFFPKKAANESIDAEPSKVIKPESTTRIVDSKPDLSKENLTTVSKNSPIVDKRKLATPPKEKTSKSKRKKRSEKEEPVKKRKRIMVFSDSESSGSEESREEWEGRCSSPEAPPPDLRVESSDEDIVPATPVTGAPSQKKVLRVKTTVDEEGFVVTSKEWGWENEAEVEDKNLDEDIEKKDVINRLGKVSEKKEEKKELDNEFEKKDMKNTKKNDLKRVSENGSKKEVKKEVVDSDAKEVKQSGEKSQKEVKESKSKSKKNQKERKTDSDSSEIEDEPEKKSLKEMKADKEATAKLKKKEKENKTEATKKEKEPVKSESKKKTNKVNDTAPESNKTSKKRKVIDVEDTSEDEVKGNGCKVAGPQAAKRQPAKKQPLKKPAANGSGTQTNIMSFFTKK